MIDTEIILHFLFFFFLNYLLSAHRIISSVHAQVASHEQQVGHIVLKDSSAINCDIAEIALILKFI